MFVATATGIWKTAKRVKPVNIGLMKVSQRGKMVHPLHYVHFPAVKFAHWAVHEQEQSALATSVYEGEAN
jgi:hypothetical protein